MSKTFGLGTKDQRGRTILAIVAAKGLRYPDFSVSAASPTLEGFRAAFRRPSLTLAEIAWRWSVGVTATALFFFGLFEFLNTLPVTNGELLFLRSRQPYLVSQALAHILRGSLSRAVMSALVAVLMLTLLWIIAAAVGRLATVRALLDYFRKDGAGYISNGGSTGDGGRIASNISTNGASFPALVRLNFLRAAVALAAVCGLLGAAILAGFVSPDTHPRPGLAFLLFLPLAGLVYLVWSSLNWFLSLAGIFAVRGGEDAVGAISAAVTLCRERAGAVSAVSTWTGLAHLVAFVGAATVVSIPLGFAPLVSWRLVVVAMIFITVAYFVLADWLYLARLAGYVCIAEMPQEVMAPVPPWPQSGSTGGLQVAPAISSQTTIDRDEVILSDVPNLAVET